eukprot:4676620-Karenia_brevis.AAC.1
MAPGHRSPGTARAISIMVAEAAASRAGTSRSPGTAAVAATMVVEANEARERHRKTARFSPYDDGSRLRSSSLG